MTSAIAQPSARRKFWGWGREDEGLSAREVEQLGATLAGRLRVDGLRVQDPPRTEELDLRVRRQVAPDSLAAIFSADSDDRPSRSYGRAFRDLVRAFRRD